MMIPNYLSFMGAINKMTEMYVMNAVNKIRTCICFHDSCATTWKATPEQWIAMDDISNNYANHTLKLTTRQTFQFHGILKRNLKSSMKN